MDETTGAAPARSLWWRALAMLLMALAFQLAAWLLVAVAVLQLLLAVLGQAPNERLRAFGASLGRYLGQIAAFVSFCAEQAPFPFSDWPAAAP